MTGLNLTHKIVGAGARFAFRVADMGRKVAVERPSAPKPENNYRLDNRNMPDMPFSDSGLAGLHILDPLGIPGVPGAPGSPSDPFHQRCGYLRSLLKQNNYTFSEAARIDRALRYAAKMHSGQLRVSGEIFLNHPLEVTIIIVETLGKIMRNRTISEIIKMLGFSHVNLVEAGLLHDVIEDGKVGDQESRYAEIRDKFGEATAKLVLGVTKFPKADFETAEERRLESFRRLFLAIAYNFGVVLLKLADRLHNMRTLMHMPGEARKRIAEETALYFIPLADIFGMWDIKRELEDLAFKYMHPGKYRKTKAFLSKTSAIREKLVLDLLSLFGKVAQQSGVTSSVLSFKARTTYSLFDELSRRQYRNETMLDMDTIEIIVPEISDCYKVIGEIKKTMIMVGGSEKNYIEAPKFNFYSSWNLSVDLKVFGRIRVKVRTKRLQDTNSRGVAARVFQQEKNLSEEWHSYFNYIREAVRDSRSLYEDLQGFLDVITVFTPKGRMIMLPKGSSILDYASAVHSDFLYISTAGEVGKEQLPLDTKLVDGWKVRILLSREKDFEQDRLLYWTALSRANRSARQAFRK